MSKISAQRQLCQGYANCMVEAPDYFDLDDDDLVVVLNDEPNEEDLTEVRAAVRSCPAKVLKLEEQP